jgi:dipeptidyl aminopeptidase/acylaminoacyl peptidase
MRPYAAALIALFASTLSAQEARPFTLQQVMSAPFANNLTAAPVGSLFAWVEDAEGRHNLWVGGKDTPARQLTHYSEDDGQDITRLAWSPDATAIAYTYGTSNGADGKPANPAHLQRPTPVQVIVQPLAADTKPIVIGDGRNPLYARDGKSLYYLRDGQIWVACLMSCHPEQAQRAEGPDIKSVPSAHQMVFDRGSASSLTLSPDGNTLAFISRRRETNEPSHSLLALFNLQTHTLAFPAPSTGDDSAPAWSPDGKQLAWLRAPFTDTPEFALNRTSANPWSIKLLDLSSDCHPERSEGPASVPCTPAYEEASRPKRSEVERPAVGTTHASRTLYSPQPNKPGSVLPIPDDEAPYLLWTADKKIIFYSEADGWDHLYSLDPRTLKPPTLLTPGNYEVEDATVDQSRDTIYFASNEPAGNSPTPDRRHIWQLKAGGTPTDVGVTRLGSEVHPQPSAEGIGALLSDNMYPMHPALWSDGFWAFLNPFDPGTTQYPDGRFVLPTQVVFPSTDNLQIHAQLFLPKQKAGPSPAAQDDKVMGGDKVAEKHPAIIFMHGGPRRQMLLGYQAMEYYSNAYAMNQYLTSRGFIVLSVNYRCGIGYGLDFRQCDHEGATGAAEYNDILAAQKYLASRPDVDARRIGLWGGSYGGYLTALGLARNSDLFAAGVDFHGVHDWNLEDNAGDWKRGSNAEQDAIAAKALQSSPLGNLSAWKSPILLIHGDNDPSVAYAQTPLLAEALRARNTQLPKAQQVDVEELIFPDEVHEFLLHRDWLAAYTAAAAFFERTLKP